MAITSRTVTDIVCDICKEHITDNERFRSVQRVIGDDGRDVTYTAEISITLYIPHIAGSPCLCIPCAARLLQQSGDSLART